MLKISYSKYKINREKLISKEEYELIKKAIDKDINYQIQPKISFMETHNFELIFFILGLIGASLIYNDTLWIKGLGVLIVLISLGVILRFLFSLESYFNYVNEQKRFYSKLKKEITESNNFDHFLSMTKEDLD